MSNRSGLTDLLTGFTFLVSLEFVTELDDGMCNLALVLAETEYEGSRTVRAEFGGVANLSVKGIGGGLTQLLLIYIEDVSDRQLDRIHYEVKELERDTLFFFCRTVSIIAA